VAKPAVDDPKLARLRTLIVDDNVHMRALLRRLLFARGIRETAEAVDGYSAITMLGTQEFDLILSDLEMQPMNGIEFTRMVRRGKANNHVPIIMVSGHTDVNHVRDARDAGVTEFLVKPVTPKNLFDRIGDVFERPRPFVSSPDYVGPERRRRPRTVLDPKRRNEDGNIVEVE
jgi:two-component system, chemotaxis family, chemotaxis protein CheY